MSFTVEKTKIALLYLVVEVILSTNTGKYYCMVRHMTGYADGFLWKLQCRGCCDMGHPKLSAELDEILGSPHIILNPQGQGGLSFHKDGGKA